MEYAIIEHGVVTNIIVADSQEIAEEISGKTAIVSGIAGIGWLYDIETGIVTPPQPVEQPVEQPVAEIPAE